MKYSHQWSTRYWTSCVIYSLVLYRPSRFTHTSTHTHIQQHTEARIPLQCSHSSSHLHCITQATTELAEMKWKRENIQNFTYEMGFRKKRAYACAVSVIHFGLMVSPLTTTIRIVLFNLFIFVWTEIKRRKEMAHTHTQQWMYPSVYGMCVCPAICRFSHFTSLIFDVPLFFIPNTVGKLLSFLYGLMVTLMMPFFRPC